LSGPNRSVPCAPARPSGEPMTTSDTAPPRYSQRSRWPPAGVTSRTLERHRHEEFLAFLKLVAKTYPRKELHIVVDNYGTHTHPAVKDRLRGHQRS
jgi:hypothetical protein